jgi:predicted O-methyltransferase YrrM
MRIAGHPAGTLPRDLLTGGVAVGFPRPSRPEEATIAATTPALKPASWAFAEGFIDEDDILAAARERAAEVGVAPVGTGVGAALRLLASAIGARHVAEVGTGTGVSGLWLLRGMAADGILTSVDLEAEHQRLAREAFVAAGVSHTRLRLIAGAALEVLPRLADGAYDMVVCDGDKTEYEAYLEEAVRLLRPGGIVAFDNALWHDRVADPAQHDAETEAIRAVGRRLKESEHFLTALLPVGDGLLVGLKADSTSV